MPRLLFAFALAVLSLAAMVCPQPAVAECEPVIDSYYVANPANPEHPNQCDDGPLGCHIDLKGIRYDAAGPNPPVIIYNHGSEERVRANRGSAPCKLAELVVPLGYSVYAPIRRGHAAFVATESGLGVEYRSTGKYVVENYFGCDRWDELERQVVDVRLGIRHVKDFNGVQPTTFAMFGSSFGGILTVFANAKSLGQGAAVAIAAGADSWIGTNGLPNVCLQDKLKAKAGRALSPTFFMQAQWDYDTRPTSELSYVVANTGPAPEHGQVFQAAIFDFGDPADPETTHGDFAKQTGLWGDSVLAFFVRHGVTP